MEKSMREITSNRVVFPDNKTLDEVIEDLKKNLADMEDKIKAMEGEGNGE